MVTVCIAITFPISLIDHPRSPRCSADLLAELQCSCKAAPAQPATTPVDRSTSRFLAHPGLEPCDRRLRRSLPVWLRGGVHLTGVKGDGDRLWLVGGAFSREICMGGLWQGCLSPVRHGSIQYTPSPVGVHTAVAFSQLSQQNTDACGVAVVNLDRNITR